MNTHISRRTMHYLKCPHCGYLHEAKGPYLTFCASCRKKLPNNFTDWKIANPGKDYEEYKSLVCIPESGLPPEPKKRKNVSKKKTSYWIGFILSMAVFSVIGTVAGESLMDLIRTGKTPQSVLEKAWKRTECGSLGLSVEAPFPLKPDDLPLPEQTRLVIEEMHVYTSPSFRRMKIMASSIRYVPEVGQANLEGAAQGALAEMQAQEGVEDFTFSQEYIEEPGLSGFVQKGTYTLHGIEIEFQSIGYVQGLALHYVVVSYPQHDPVDQQVAERILTSAQIRPPSTGSLS